MKVTVKDVQGIDRHVDVANNATVLDVKTALAQVQSIKVGAVQLVFGGKKLSKDEDTLAQCGVSDGATLYQILGGPGG